MAGQALRSPVNVSLNNIISLLIHIIIILVYDCGSTEITSPQNGIIEYNQTIFGSVAVFNCTDGYDLIGPSTRTCKIYGWSDEANPVCGILINISYRVACRHIK